MATRKPKAQVVRVDKLDTERPAPRWHTEDELALALEQHRGFVSFTAKSLGISFQALYNRISKSPRLQQVRKAVEEAFLDCAENNIVTAVIQGKDLRTSQYVMSTKGRHRGYVERTEVTGADGAMSPYDALIKAAEAAEKPRGKGKAGK
jgi:hypothetical protein